MRYTVRSGDTLPEIARRFRVDVNAIIRLNPSIRSPRQRLRVGEVIRLPAEVVVDVKVPEPVIERIIPGGATGVTTRIVRMSRGRVPERVLLCRRRVSGRTFTCVIVIRFLPHRGWHTVYHRDNIAMPLQFLGKGRLYGDDREQVVIGNSVSYRNTPGLSFLLLGGKGDRVVEMMDRLDDPVPQGTVRVENGRLVVDSAAGTQSFVWNGTAMVEGR